MKLHFFEEPELEFGRGSHIDIRFGLMQHGPLDYDTSLAPKKIRVGIVGTNETISGVCAWLEKCRSEISPKDSKKPNLFPYFPGFNPEDSFQSELVFDSSLQRPLPPANLKRLLQNSAPNQIVREAVELYLNDLRYLAENTNADVLLCAHPTELLDKIENAESMANVETSQTSPDDDDGPVHGERLVFHDMLKAEAMSQVRKPLQIIRPTTWDEKARRQQKRKANRIQSLQDEATRAWNIHTALYYKAGGVPWRLIRDPALLTTCYVGISFYVSLDKETVMTSMAQVFNQRGEGVIVRGGAAQISKEDRQIHLKRSDACTLLRNALGRYRDEHRTLPARVVLHKTSSFNTEEIAGFNEALDEKGIDYHDFVSISTSQTRIFRHGTYAPLRGTMLSLSDKQHLLYSKGSVDFWQTYPGLYIPNPRLIRCDETTESPSFLAQEIMALTKMNWNNTQFDGALPITLRAARQVGLILRYIPEGGHIEPQYRYYM
ncbi:hypothetical protein [Armatimonas sp.]|uniref:argonaute/piwi family protein n=1 Tax=Armatimonas sp. TaxID=1872638 RepID=UPI00286C5FF1|nr:hypothetical protein [Armatimonas sp.]